MNWFFEKENTGDRGREWGFSQSAMIPVLLPNERLKIGIEMEYKNVTTKDTRGDPLNSFVIGPTVAWKPTASTRIDISPLFGCTDDSPVADVFVAFSWLFGGERGEAEAEAPVSSRFRYLSKVSRADKNADKEMKQVAPPPCPEWYGDNEWNVNLFGTYAFTNTEYNPNLWLVDVVQSTSEGNPVLGTYDHYIGGDHAWGGGGDIKYFFHRYFGVGIEGFALDASKNGFDIFEDPTVPIFTTNKINHDHTIGAVLGTLTLRYPIPCTRFAPYAWAGAGAIFGGGERDILHTQGPPDAFAVHAQTDHFGSETKVLGQFGAGLEFRIARHIGWTNDLSFGVIDGPKNNFGMVRSGLSPTLPKTSSGLTAPKSFGVAEVERPQPGGAGCGYTSLSERLVSSLHQRSGRCSRNVDKQSTGVIPSCTDKCQSRSDRGTSHKLIDHTNNLRVTLARCVRPFSRDCGIRMTRVYC